MCARDTGSFECRSEVVLLIQIIQNLSVKLFVMCINVGFYRTCLISVTLILIRKFSTFKKTQTHRETWYSLIHQTFLNTGYADEIDCIVFLRIVWLTQNMIRIILAETYPQFTLGPSKCSGFCSFECSC